ncbi:alpha/beta hydrolase domain-containing protein [Paeniglutamicibacter sp. ZC-3]|uniref:alpha/beta hydrolase domain-containing protein n=1 Tax=Paeniglutamicibacter sp. ZC-3 TaxID=2986919 RepID=UPI0021F78011|nr:alpha/beta hydrolase domain-containing protein [Paeniglutamicibacter sp. ZC-3]MCV9993960.1 alpha/beta hydrolase domain-containing protein [Paeniglutamicibacter sp. ZC-3]
MPNQQGNRRYRRVMAAACIGALGLTIAATPAGAAAQRKPSAGIATLDAVPEVVGPIATTDDSYPWSALGQARVPLDVTERGYVEEEYFLSGTANVYDNAAGEPQVVTQDVPYTNHILVRRPASKADSSGVVLVDILNASNGFPGEDHLRRMWEWALEEGHTIIGVTSKPIQVDALKNFDPERYADLSWDVQDVEREAIIADPADPAAFDPFMVVPGAEEGLAWDIITQVGTLLESKDGRSVLGGQTAKTVLLMGQSQSGIYLNTYVSNFHEVVTEANHGPVFDGYLNTVGAVLERPLRQGTKDGLVTVPGSEPALDVPFITVTSEGDADLFGAATLAEKDLPANRRHWQVPGTPHTDLLSPVIPADGEILKAGRLPNTAVHDAAFRESLNPYPLEPAVIAATEALIDWGKTNKEAAPSRWFDQTDGVLGRNEDGNVAGGVRNGLIEHPLGQYRGAAAPGAVYGSVDLISAADFAKTYGTRTDYLALIGEVDADLIEQGYLTPWGAEYFSGVANNLMDRIGVPTGQMRASG